jgi:hypothetical protein
MELSSQCFCTFVSSSEVSLVTTVKYVQRGNLFVQILILFYYNVLNILLVFDINHIQDDHDEFHFINGFDDPLNLIPDHRLEK